MALPSIASGIGFCLFQWGISVVDSLLIAAPIVEFCVYVLLGMALYAF